MKQLSLATTNDLKAQEQARDLIRAEEIREITKEINIGRANADADFQATLARNRTVWAQEELDHQRRKIEMDKEISKLEAERLSLLIPIGIIGKGAGSRMEEAVNFLASLKEREKNVDELTELLQDKLDSVGEREETVRTREQRVELKEMGVKNQYESTIEGSKALSKEIKDFAVIRGKAEKEIGDKKETLTLKEKTLNSREASLVAREKSLNDTDRQLKDERGTLARAWAELERMKANIPIENKGK